MNNNQIGDANDVFGAYELELVAATQRELAAERAAWESLPQAERDRICAERAEASDRLWRDVEAAAAGEEFTECRECGEPLSPYEAEMGETCDSCADCEDREDDSVEF